MLMGSSGNYKKASLLPSDNKEMLEVLTSIETTLKEILKWVKVTSIPNVKKLLLEVLSSDEEKIAYHYSDGRGSQDIAKLVRVSHTTVTRWWKAWIYAGIAENVSVKGGERARRIFSLENFGIEVPQVKVKPEITDEKSEIPIKEKEGEIFESGHKN